jgi:hypothetical protein
LRTLKKPHNPCPRNGGRATRSLVMPSSSNPRPLLSSNNKGHQASARHNQPLGMTVMPTSYLGVCDYRP